MDGNTWKRASRNLHIERSLIKTPSDVWFPYKGVVIWFFLLALKAQIKFRLPSETVPGPLESINFSFIFSSTASFCDLSLAQDVLYNRGSCK